MTTAGIQRSGQFVTSRTGAPGESSCGGCHSGNVNTGSGSILSNFPSEYVPDSVYDITFTLNDGNFPSGEFGFTATSLTSAGNQQAGTFTVTNTNNTATASGNIGGQSRQYVGHRNSSGTNAWNFQWTAPSTNQGDITFYLVGVAANGNGSTSGDFTYTATTSSSIISTFPQPLIEKDKLFACGSDTIIFSENSTGNINDYSWNFGTGASPATAVGPGPHKVVFNSGGNKNIVLITSGPDGSASTNIPFPVYQVSTLNVPDNVPPICAGTTSQLNLDATGGLAPYTYQISCLDGDCGVVDSLSANALLETEVFFSPTDTFTYRVIVGDQSGCPADTSLINIITYPLPLAHAGDDQTVCEGDAFVSLNGRVDNSANSPAPYFYEWSPANLLNDPNIANPEVLTLQDQIFKLTVLDGNGCRNIDSSISEVSLQISEAPLPVISASGIILEEDSLSGPPAASYAWYHYDSLSMDTLLITATWAQGSSIRLDSLAADPNFVGAVLLEVTYANGCSRYSSPKAVNVVTIVCSCEENFLEVYPNPASGVLNVITDQDGELLLYNKRGQLVLRQDLAEERFSINIEGLSPGLYFVRYQGDKRFDTKKIWIR